MAKKYTVLSHLLHDNNEYNEGDVVELTDKQGKHLQDSNVVGDVIPEPKKDDGKKGANK